MIGIKDAARQLTAHEAKIDAQLKCDEPDWDEVIARVQRMRYICKNTRRGAFLHIGSNLNAVLVYACDRDAKMVDWGVRKMLRDLLSYFAS